MFIIYHPADLNVVWDTYIICQPEFQWSIPCVFVKIILYPCLCKVNCYCSWDRRRKYIIYQTQYLLVVFNATQIM